MRGVHASPNNIAPAVLVVPVAGGVRVIAISIPIRGGAILISIRIRVSVVVIVGIIRVAESEAAAPESTATKFAESGTTGAETTIMECHATTAEAAMEAAAAKAAAMETATTEAAAMAPASAAAASQRHRWRSHADRCNGQ